MSEGQATNNQSKLIADNLQRLREAIIRVCTVAGRRPEEITVVAVSKTMPPELVAAAIRSGVTDIGENRVQEAVRKKPQVMALLGDRVSNALQPSVRWHMIGHLQTNKVKKALETFDVFHSVDSLRLAQEMGLRCSKPVPVLVEVNTSAEPSKFGVQPVDLSTLVAQLMTLRNLKIIGLMTIGPGLSIHDPEQSRRCFRQLRGLRESLKAEFGLKLLHLSMGMSSDYAVAIQEGATLLRIGAAIFGARGP